MSAVVFSEALKSQHPSNPRWHGSFRSIGEDVAIAIRLNTEDSVSSEPLHIWSMPIHTVKYTIGADMPFHPEYGSACVLAAIGLT